VTEADWASTDARTLLAFVAVRSEPRGSVVPQVRLSERKLRLFQLACFRRQWPSPILPVLRVALLTVERFAEGGASESDRARAEEAVAALCSRMLEHPVEVFGPSPGVSLVDALEQASAAQSLCVPYERLLTQYTYTYPGRPHGFVPVHPRDRLIQADDVLRRVLNVVSRPAPGEHLPSDRILLARKAAEEATQAELLRCVTGNPFAPVRLDPRWITSTAQGLAYGIYEERAFDRLPVLADSLEDAGCEDVEILSHCRSGGAHCLGCWVVDLVLGKE
jgi:hypothetical protein